MVSNSPLLSKMVSRISAAVRNIGPNLQGQIVLTEAASGPFLATSVLAAVSGAKHVIACTRDSCWGTAEEIRRFTIELAGRFDVADRIEVSTKPAAEMADGVDVVTNLGFVRPILPELIRRLSPHASIALMWEPWEFREQDIDLIACREHGIPVIGTNEHHPYVATFNAVGMFAFKLLFELQIEVGGLDILVVGSDPFGKACFEVLKAVGARVLLIDPQYGWSGDIVYSAFERADAVVLVEHRFQGELLGSSALPFVETLARRHTPVVHICGSIDNNFLKTFGIEKHPVRVVPVGYMTETTAYMGVKPVVDLHTAGLHVASIVARERHGGATIDKALDAAVASGYGLKLLNPSESIYMCQ